MFKLLIVAATAAEISPLLDHYKKHSNSGKELIQLMERTDVELLVTGVGMVNTAFMLGKHLSKDYDLVINAGICGAFDRKLEIGELVNITEDMLIEMGAENGEEFIPYVDLNLGGTNSYKNQLSKKYNFLSGVKSVNAVTVNKVHGHEESIRITQSRFTASVESMEGAAFLRACEGAGVECLQLRTVSNYVEKRDRSKWNIPLAVKNLNAALIRAIEELTKNRSL